MVKSKHFRGAVAAWLLVLLSFAGGVRAEISPRSTGDELLQILPAESLFCVRVNNLDQTLSTIDQFLVGVSPMPMGVSMLVRMQFSKILGSPELNGVNMGGSFALFGVTAIGKSPGPKPSDMFIGALVPITDYKQFIDGNPNLSPPDANGVSKNTGSEFGGMLIKQVGNYALIGPSESGTFAATAKLISVKSAKLGSVLDAAEVRQAMKEPLWVYGNVQQASKSFGPLLFGQLEQMKNMIQIMASSQQGSMGPTVKIMDMYIAIFETLMKETNSLSLTVRPRPNACNLSVSISAVPGTEMANMFVADTSIVKENRLLGYLEDGAMMNFAGKMNTPFWKQLNLKSIDLLTVIAGESMTAEDITKMKMLTTDWISALGGPTVFSFFIDANSKPPFALKYVLEVKDADKFNKVIEEAMEMMNAGGIADFYKSLGIEMGFTIKRGVGSYKGVSIDTAKLVMKSTDPNLPQGQMIDAMYGDGFDYRWAIVDGLWVCTIGGDVDSAIRKLIDEVKAGGPEQMAAEMKAALRLLPEAATADFMGTYNFLRLFKMAGAMAGAFMPVPMPVAQMDIPTKSNIVFAGKVSNGKMRFEIALPKEHLIEMMGMFQRMSMRPEKRAMPQQRTIQQGPVVGVIREDEDRMGTVTDRHGDAIYGSNIRYSPLLYLGRVSKAMKIELLDQHVITNKFGIPIIKVKVLSETPTVPAGSIGWITLSKTSFADSFDPNSKALSGEQKVMRQKIMKQRMQMPEQPTINRARVTITKANLMILHSAVIQFKMDTGRFPTEEEGLMALIEQPADVTNYEPGGYLDTTEIPKDVWGNDFIYDLYPESGKPFVIISFGADGEEGGEGNDADLFSTDP